MANMNRIRTLLTWACLVSGCATPVHNAVADEPTDGEKLFALQLKSLFSEKCVSCHGGDPTEIAGGLDMRTRKGLIKGGEGYGAEVLIAGKGRDSFLYRATTRREEGYEMPPKESEKLTPEELNWLRQWIDEGAPWPDDERIAEIQDQYAQGVVVPTSGGLSDDWTNRRYQPEHLWAWQPLSRHAVPDHVHPIDPFIDRQLQQRSVNAAEPASAVQLLRRLSFNLTGLPPQLEPDSPATRFLDHFPETPQTAVRDYAEHLMSLPHYGEHFGRQWLDVVRYADSAGFANDYTRPNAWRYRDYVIRSFNQDKPYDDFVKEQLAGDEMDPNDPELRIATGFLRMGPWEHTSMSVFRVTRQQWLDDVTDSVGQSFLGHALQCAKCHDHKFDPIPTRDYYSVMAVFSTTQFAEPDTPFLPEENTDGFRDANHWIKEKIQAYERDRKALNDRVRKARQKETGDAKTGDNGLDPGDEASLARMGKNISRHKWEYDKTRPIAFSVYTGKTIPRGNVGGRIQPPENPWGKGRIEEDTILNGGDAYTRGEKVQPGPLSAATEMGGMTAAAFPAGQGKRRLAFAKWIVDPANPLTARVIVNRVWSWHFGKGLAGNPNNFGATGKPPTHPELLDYLAGWFMENGWSIRKLNKLIVTSAAYQRSTLHANPERLAQLDPRGELYAVFTPRRLTAEELRDSMLAISGELNRTVGGIPCRPDINREVAFQPRQIMGGTASVYEPDPLPEQRNRRTIYAEKIRGLRDPFMETFNQPGPDKSCELRETSTVAPQALTLFNSEEVQDRALAFANRLITSHEEQPEADIIRLAFRSTFAREPSPTELHACVDHWQRCAVEEREKSWSSAEFPDRIQRTVMAEKTGEPYDFVEFMPAYQNYKPDLQPSEVDARTRGLARVCLVLLNTNEFAYLD